MFLMASHFLFPLDTSQVMFQFLMEHQRQKSFVEKEVTIMERKRMEDEGIPVIKEEDYVLDGIFCLGHCRQAFLETNINAPFYKDSPALLK